MPEIDEQVVPAAHARAFAVETGALITVAQTTGHQVVDMIAFVQADTSEYLSPSHNIASLGRMWPVVGQSFLSNRRQPLLELVEDTVGRHDLTMAACDPARYERDYGVGGHRSCSDNFLEVFSALRLERHQLPNPVNLFQNIAYLDNGDVEFRRSLAGPGDRVTLRVLRPLIVGFSACPMDLNPISGGEPSDVVVRIARP